jgi:crotonobetainyl-CoA:carnitine CoA-transferase CaiB-like acyl-CoA transferase
LRAVLLTRVAMEWEELLGDQVPCAVARRVEEMFDHSQVAAEGMVASIPHPTLGSYRGVSRPIKFGRAPGPEPFAAPTLGQHSDAVIAATEASGKDTP